MAKSNRRSAWPGCFGQSALMGVRRTNTIVATARDCTALIVDKNDLLHLFTTDPRSAARLCHIVLADRSDAIRLRDIECQLKIRKLPPGEERAALVVGMHWRRVCDRQAQKHDSLYRLIVENVLQPSDLDSRQSSPFSTAGKSTLGGVENDELVRALSKDLSKRLEASEERLTAVLSGADQAELRVHAGLTASGARVCPASLSTVAVVAPEHPLPCSGRHAAETTGWHSASGVCGSVGEQ